MGFSTLVFFVITLVLGGLVGYGIFSFFNRNKLIKNHTEQNSTVLLEKIEKVFKVVMSEGYFTEILDYKDDKSVLDIFKSSKKALVIAKSKVLVGFDFGKMQYDFDERSKKMLITFFPEPEILSIDTDYKFYDVDNGLFNRFKQDDYTQLIGNAKQTMQEKALQSDLPRIANNQIQFMMYQLAGTMGWGIDLKLPEANAKKLAEFSSYETIDATPTTL